MDKFYINCALKEDLNISCVKITKKYYDDRLKSFLSNFPLPVVKISSGGKSCYAQLRVASNLYKNNFNRYINYSGEKQIFENSECGELPILFISEHYRNLLGIDINQEVKDDNDVKYNTKELIISPPKNLLSYLLYIILAAYDHPEIYSFFMFLITIFSLALSMLSCLIATSFDPIFIYSIVALLVALLIPTKYISFRISLSLVWLAIVLPFICYYLSANICGG